MTRSKDEEQDEMSIVRDPADWSCLEKYGIQAVTLPRLLPSRSSSSQIHLTHPILMLLSRILRSNLSGFIMMMMFMVMFLPGELFEFRSSVGFL